MNAEEAKKYTRIISNIITSKIYRPIFDETLKQRIYSFFSDYALDMETADLKRLCNSMVYCRIPKTNPHY